MCCLKANHFLLTNGKQRYVLPGYRFIRQKRRQCYILDSTIVMANQRMEQSSFGPAQRSMQHRDLSTPESSNLISRNPMAENFTTAMDHGFLEQRSIHINSIPPQKTIQS